MTYQSNSNATVAFKKQAGKGVQASGASGIVIPIAGGSGLQFSKASVNSKTVRRDGMMKKGRHGTNKVAGAWDTEVFLGGGAGAAGHVETILEAVLRDTWDAAALTLTEAQFTSLAVAANVVTLGGGDPRTLGLRVGDVIRPSLMSAAGNNNINVRVSALSGTTITTPDTLANQAADTACTITRPKKLIQFAGGSLIRRYFTVEEYDADIDQSEVATDFVFGGFKFTMQADGTVGFSFSGTGTGQFDALATGASPLLTSPVDTVGDQLAVVDATIRVKGVDVMDLTGFELTADIGAVAPATFGSGAQKYSPDVFTGNLGLGLNISALRKDLQAIQDFSAETAYDLHVVMARPGATPADFLSMYVGNFTLGGVAKSALSNDAGGRSQTLTVPAALAGIDQRGAGFDPTMIKFQSTGI